MSNIYVITNIINGKQYVGKTYLPIQKRFRQHINSCNKERCKHRSLYRAMNKYGINNFKIDLIEITNKPEDRERYWIHKLNTYGKNGYNDTLGGDGKPYIDEKQVIEVYKDKKNCSDVAKICNCHRDSVIAILKRNNVTIYDAKTVIKNKYGRGIAQYSEGGQLLRTFKSSHEAVKFLGKDDSSGSHSHISDAAKGKRKSAYGYIWKFID